MRKTVQSAIFRIVQKLYLDAGLQLENIDVSYPPAQFGDYSSNVAMQLAGRLKKNPKEIAQQLKAELDKSDLALEKVQVAAPGFLNLFLDKKYLQQQVGQILSMGRQYGNSTSGQGKKVHFDFVSANPTGPVTLGNGRGGPYGDALASLLEKNGYEVWREYYVNDYGNQVKVLGHSVLKDDEAQYRGEYIDNLSERIKKTDPFEVGQEAAQIIIAELIKPSMEKLGIHFDQYFSEKSLHTSGQVEQVFDWLKSQDLIYEKEDAWWFKATQFGDEKDRVVRKKSGEVTYFGGDIAYHKNKFDRGFDQAIDIWGADHHGDVKRVMGAVEALGHQGKLKIILTQLLKVLKDGQEFRMSKRKGTYVSMDDLLQEVGKDAVRFFFLMYSSDTHMVFDLDLAKERSEKNPVYYVQYAHARIGSICRKAQQLGMEFSGEADYSRLTQEKELALIRHLNKFPELVEDIAKSYEVHKLPYYAIELADKFHSFYHDCKVLDPADKPLSHARLELVKAAQQVLAESLRLLGVSAPERM